MYFRQNLISQVEPVGSYKFADGYPYLVKSALKEWASWIGTPSTMRQSNLG